MDLRIRVPASSANLGPGFDSFAIALPLLAEFDVRPARAWSVSVDGDGDGLVSGVHHDRHRGALGRVIGQEGLQRERQPVAAKGGPLRRVVEQWPAPHAQRLEHRPQLPPAGGEPEQGGRDRRRRRLPGDDAVLLQLAEPFGEQVGGDPGQPVLQVGVARPVGDEQLAHDEQRPSIAHQVERPGHGAELVIRAHADDVTPVL